MKLEHLNIIKIESSRLIWFDLSSYGLVYKKKTEWAKLAKCSTRITVCLFQNTKNKWIQFEYVILEWSYFRDSKIKKKKGKKRDLVKKLSIKI